MTYESALERNEALMYIALGSVIGAAIMLLLVVAVIGFISWKERKPKTNTVHDDMQRFSPHYYEHPLNNQPW